MFVLLLAVLLTRAHLTETHLPQMFVSILSNTTFLWIEPDVNITCGGKFNCSRIIHPVMQAINIDLLRCSPSLLRCGHIAHPALLASVNLRHMTEPLEIEDIKDLRNVIRLNIHLNDVDTSIPSTVINSWRTLKYLGVSGGNLHDLHSSKVVHSSLNDLQLTHNNLSSLPPDFFEGLSSLASLQIRDNNIENIGVGTFKGLNNLVQLNLHNIGLQSIEIGTFSDTPELKTLLLSDNPLKALPNDLLVELKSLQVFHLSITSRSNTKQDEFKLGSFALSKLPELKTVTLTNLNIDTLPENLFNGSTKLSILNIPFNLISNLSLKMFLQISNLRRLDLTGNMIHELPNTIFDKLFILNTLILRENKIQQLPQGIFNKVDTLVSLDISNNHINMLSSDIFLPLDKYLKELDMHNNSIEELPKEIFEGLSGLIKLDFSYNKIQRLPKDLFSNLHNLLELDLGDNEIDDLTMLISIDFKRLLEIQDENVIPNEKMIPDPNGPDDRTIWVIIDDYVRFVYKGLRRLTKLVLRNNKLTYLPTLDAADIMSGIYSDQRDISSILSEETDAPSYRFVSPFTVLPYLEILDLSGNKIASLFSGWEYDMRHIKLLNLSRNCFTDTQISRVDISSINIKIDLRDNNMSNKVLYEAPLPLFHTRRANSTVLLNSPIVCDCHSYGLYLRTKGARFLFEPQFKLDDSRCIAPPHLNGQLFKYILAGDLVCDLSKDCPKNCSKCIMTAETNEVIMECREFPSIPASILAEFPTKSRNYTFDLMYPPKNIGNVVINKLNLSNTGLDHISFEPNTFLKILDVSHNHLETISDNFLKGDITLYLSDNPWKCDCSFTKKLNRSFVADFKFVTCADNVKLADIDVQRLCNWKYALAGYLCTATLCGLFLLKCIITTRKQIKNKWRNIKRIVLRRGSESSLQLEKRLDKAKEFDLFISFAHEDTDFVRDNLMPKIENEFKQKVCIHYRDWIAGELIADQIIESVERSRRTVIILTEYFLKSEWSFLEFRTAHDMSIREGRPRVIMILPKEDVVNSVKMDRDIKSYIAINTYLLWEDPDFWEKFKKLLPKKH